ncbi:zinc finger protein 569-like [Uranotaenia lowii]|uniref:zinc finger protein 569-like n=1 Tax=Uranotaenia lowii TaxID=190385 RepID=UPI00247911E1|nr:zinc finger protein 569-like [Uranotaenia lowii]
MTTCRLCLQDLDHLVDGNGYTIHKIQNQISAVFKFEIITDPRLSEAVCSCCIALIEQFYNYVENVHQNQLQLYAQLNKNCLLASSETTERNSIDVKDGGSESPPPPPGTPDGPSSSSSSENRHGTQASESPKVEEQTKGKASVTNKSRFQKNLISRHLNMSCDICKQDMYTYTKLESHFKKCHGGRCYIICCAQKLTTENMIAQHLEKHMVRSNLNSAMQQTSNWKLRVFKVFGSILEDFEEALGDYEPLPNMELALEGDSAEQQKLYDVQDFLVKKYFQLNCELCDSELVDQDERRRHFRQQHPKEKYFVSCCGERFSQRISIMRHLNKHWKMVDKVAQEHTYAKICRQESEDVLQMKGDWKQKLRSTYHPLMYDFREDLIEGGYSPPTKVPYAKFNEMQKQLFQMQDFLIAKHCPLKCDLCGIEISTYIGRREHFRIGHPNQSLYVQCCGKKISTRYRIILHLVRHREGLPSATAEKFAPRDIPNKADQDEALIEKFFQMDCELCDYGGSSYTDLKDHFKEHHRNEKFFITCCNRQLTSKHHIMEHIAFHQKPGTIKCDHCEATFFSERCCIAHIKRKHGTKEEKLFQCPHCPEVFDSRNHLVLHSYKHEMARCDICGVEMNARQLRVHRINVHKLGEEVVCNMCAKVFHSKPAYNRHYRVVHLGIKKKSKKKCKAQKRSLSPKYDGSELGLSSNDSIIPDTMAVQFLNG